MNDPVDWLFLIGVVLLAAFFAVLSFRAFLVNSRGRTLIRHGTLPVRSGPDGVVTATCRSPMSAEGMAALTVVALVVIVHSAVTDGLWGVLRSFLGIALIVGLGPVINAIFWMGANSNDTLARACRRLLNWSIACLTIPILSLL